jgi:hypothetical protein
MTPEAIKIFKEQEDHLVSHALQGEEKQLKGQINQALAEKKYPEAQTALHKLESADATQKELAAAFDKVAEILISSGLAEIEIPYYIPSPPEEEHSSSTDKKNGKKEPSNWQGRERKPRSALPGLRETSYSPYRDTKTFVENCLAQAMRSTIAKDRHNGRFTFKDSQDIASMMLQPNLRRNPEALERAHRRYLDGQSDIIKKINLAAKKTGAKTLEELFEPVLPLVKNPAWEAFYEEAVENYGHLSPKDFTEKILRRSYPARD